MRKFFAKAALAPLLLASSLSAQAATWVMDPEGSSVIFKYSYSDTPYQGEFKNVTATFEIDPLSPANCKFEVNIPIADIYVDSEETLSYMLDIELFDVDQFPTARFVADKCTLDSLNSFTAAGQVTIRDVTQPISFPFKLDIEGMRFRLTSEVTLKRLDFGVGQGYFANTSAIPNDVVVTVDVFAKMQ
ncbi:MAG: YceI family protein [Pseudohongiella sp.]|nr:YceI family protein [Pseudohongiella sp.]